MKETFEDLSDVLEGADIDPETAIKRNVRGREALPLDYVGAIEGMLFAYADYKKSRSGETEAKFKEAAQRVAGMRKQFSGDQKSFLDVQPNVKIILDMHGLSEPAVDPEAVYGDEVSEEEFFGKISQKEPVGFYDKKILDIIKEASI